MSNHLAVCVAITGRNAPAGILLYRLLYWYERKTFVSGGEKWVVNSYEDWADETGLSTKQVKVALAFLRKVDLVVTEARLRFNRRLLHTRPTGKLKAQLVPFEKAQLVPTGKDQSVPHIIEHGDNFMEYLHGVATGVANGTDDATSDPEKDAKMRDLSSKSIKDKIASATMVSQPSGKLNLGMLWQTEVAKVYPGFHKPLTQKELGQLKLVLKFAPGDMVETIVRKAITSWPDFVMTVQAEEGLKTVPQVPRIDFLLKYLNAAVNFVIGTPQQTPAPVIKAHEPVKLTSPVPAKKPKMSQAEVMAILNAKDDG